MKIEDNISALNKKIERILNDVDFIKNHMSSYLGGGTGITHLIDETPIYINTDDFGCPSNFINGGKYEEEYYNLLTSFRKPSSVFIDIGANLGVFTLRFAKMLKKGKVISFEPNPKIHDLLLRSIHLNGLSNVVDIYNLGASDQNFECFLSVPKNHAGGASLCESSDNEDGYKITAKVVDDLLSHIDNVDIVKIDVEGHELNVLRGMKKILKRSPNCVVLFEKLSRNSGIENELMEYFERLNMNVFKVEGFELVKLNLNDFIFSESYFIAASDTVLKNNYIRNFFIIYPDDMYVINGSIKNNFYCVNTKLDDNTLLAHGPYWFLPKGTYIFEFDGEINTNVKVHITEKYGYETAYFIVNKNNKIHNVVIERDLTNFEVVLRCYADEVKVNLSFIKITRVA